MIKILHINKFIKDNKFKGPITSPQHFQGKSFTFHPQGLFSEEIFGLEGSPERRMSMSWINLNSSVIHPVIYDRIQKQIDRRFDSLLSVDKQYSIGEDGQLVEDEEGEIDGMSSLAKNIHRLRFREDEEPGTDRNKMIRVLYKNIKEGTFFMDKLIVISPEYRQIQIMEEKGEVKEDDLNVIYRKILTISHQLASVSGPVYDILSYRLQLQLKDLYEYIRVKVSSKHGMIRNLMLGKRVDFSARAVITPNPNLEIGDVGIPIRIICQLFEPFMIYGLINSREASTFPDSFHEEVKKFLGRELDV
jgi:DNA-directed RNA polymerase beta' subunit